MFKLVLIVAFLGLLAAQDNDQSAQTLNSFNDPPDAEGNFAYSFDTSNRISIQESGNNEGVSGSAQWVSPEGVPIQLSYTADETGFHPSGENLPTAPPIPV